MWLTHRQTDNVIHREAPHQKSTVFDPPMLSLAKKTLCTKKEQKTNISCNKWLLCSGIGQFRSGFQDMLVKCFMCDFKFRNQGYIYIFSKLLNYDPKHLITIDDFFFVWKNDIYIIYIMLLERTWFVQFKLHHLVILVTYSWRES